MVILGMEFTPSTVVVLAIIVVLAVLAVRRIWRYGLCDCHKGTDQERGRSSSSCASGCAGCAGCGAVDQMVCDMQKTAKARR